MTDPAAVPLEFAGLTDIGRVRARNEDCFEVKRRTGLALVCDGMGGHAGGDIASRTAVEAIVEFICGGALDYEAGGAEALAAAAVHRANRRLTLLNRQRGFPEGRGMGTTVVGLWLRPGGDRAVMFHAGDSRLYRLQGDAFSQLTRDHSLYQAWLDGGGYGQAPQRNIIVRALGTAREVEPEVASVPVAPDDLFLLCSDGLTTMVADEDIAAVLHRTDDLEAGCRELVALANDKGGIDNITVVLVRRGRS